MTETSYPMAELVVQREPWWAWFVSAAEKGSSSFVQAAVIMLVAAGADWIDGGLWRAAGQAGVIAAVSTLLGLIPQVGNGLTFYADLTLRVLRTAIATALGLWIAAPIWTLDYAQWKPLVLAVGVAVLAAAKGLLLARRVGDPTTAAVLPARADVSAVPVLEVLPAAA